MKIYGVVGWKNAGKTGLMERLVAEITGRGFRVSTVKHAHHAFDVDHAGTDSYRHRAAGASEVVLASRKRVALMQEMRGAEEPGLEALLARMGDVDLVLIEGYKRDVHPKVEAHRAETGNPLIAPQDATVRAVASDSPAAQELRSLQTPVFALDDTCAIADFILAEVGLAEPAQISAVKQGTHRPDEPSEGLTNRLSDRPSDLAPPPLRDDCFALPAGVDWTPVSEALTRLSARLHRVVAEESLPLQAACGRILARDVTALRAHPAQPNAAVDGYGFAFDALGTEAVHHLPRVPGRAAAGVPFDGAVPFGAALRILTGATLPEGVDTVVLQEDVTATEAMLAFRGGIKPGANTRKAGEDKQAGERILRAGRRLTPADLALAAATGLGALPVCQLLRVGVLSTGDELVEAGAAAGPGQIYDANRVMLLAIVGDMGFLPVDLGRVEDSRTTLKQRLDAAVAQCDVILTSGGASSGEEDHVSALLQAEGALQEWRIAMKPGRPLALGLWGGVPVFGLPGNPVATLVCALIFARPAMGVLAGRGWQTPEGYALPAGFEKRKKPGRTEFLRARVRAGVVEIFASEGSGRISGLSWAEGLVELPEAACNITPGDPVRFVPYSSFL